MGSNMHAAVLKAAGMPVCGMVALEMLGYHDDRRGSQHYLIWLLKFIYDSRGN